MVKNYFKGNERLAAFEPTGQLIRMGAPQQLAITDKQKVADAIKAHDAESALAYCTLLSNNHTYIIIAFTEWCLRYPTVFSQEISSDDERKITTKAYELWKNDITPLEKCSVSTSLIQELIQTFSPEKTTPETVDTYLATLQDTEDSLAARINQTSREHYKNMLEAIQSNDFDNATQHLDNYFIEVRTLHDAFVQYTSAYPAVVYQEYDQEKAEMILSKAFSTCSFYDGLFALATAIEPGQLAAFYAEQLRTNFSGDNREGSTEIIEDEDCYRLVFKPCGTGGAMRQRMTQIKADDKYILKEASAITWGRANEVPLYCSQCARNEITYTKMVGYPVAVTEFNPDPDKPCGWTVYKDPNKIPEEYFSRVGLKKDPSKFKKPTTPKA